MSRSSAEHWAQAEAGLLIGPMAGPFGGKMLRRVDMRPH
jgi:hypothetical protein